MRIYRTTYEQFQNYYNYYQYCQLFQCIFRTHTPGVNRFGFFEGSCSLPSSRSECLGSNQRMSRDLVTRVLRLSEHTTQLSIQNYIQLCACSSPVVRTTFSLHTKAHKVRSIRVILELQYSRFTPNLARLWLL